MAPVKGNSKHGRSADLFRKLKYDLDFDAAAELVKLFRKKDCTTRDQIRIAQDIMSFQYPKLKAVELAAKQGESVIFNIDLTGIKREDKEEQKDAA